jgi:N-acetylneuraminic acid mutarotase
MAAERSPQYRTRRVLRAAFWPLLGSLTLLSACGGGGGGDDESLRPNNGWVAIEEPKQASSLFPITTADESVLVAGTTFTSTVQMTWSNDRGGGGPLSHGGSTCTFFGLINSACDHRWLISSVPLAVGVNTITVKAWDASGNSGAATVAITRTADVKPPTVTRVDPANGERNVPLRGQIRATFREALQPATVTSSTFVLTDMAGNKLAGAVSYADGVAIFSPARALDPLSLFTATITTGIKDQAGNALVTPFTWTFITDPGPDVTGPSVIATSPANGSSCIDTEVTISASFSEEIALGHVTTNNFTLKDANHNAISGSTKASTTNTVTYQPSAPLSGASTYTATLTRDIRDLASNFMAADYSWSFSTVRGAPGTWLPTAKIGSPVSTPGSLDLGPYAAVWTGTEMIVWGSRAGARYNPMSDIWTALNNVGGPSLGTAVWTGSEMIACGGSSCARYDPRLDSWRGTSAMGAPSFSFDNAVWTGSEMVVMAAFNRGSRYNPASDTWRPMSPVGAPAVRARATLIWTGSRILVWGGIVSSFGGVADTGGIYDPSSDTWGPITDVGAPVARHSHTAVWTGTEMLIWGGGDTSTSNTGARYNPQSDTWRSMSMDACPLSARLGHSAVWNGTEMIVWGGFSQGNYFNSGARYDPLNDSWLRTSNVNAPTPRMGHKAFWTGTNMLIWGSVSYLEQGPSSGGMYQP